MADNMVINESLDRLEIQQTYDAVAAWLRDCVRQGNVLGVKHAESKLKQLEPQLTETVEVKENAV